jgi:hypothetical protein
VVQETKAPGRNLVKSVGLSRAKKLQLGSECETHSQAGCMSL